MWDEHAKVIRHGAVIASHARVSCYPGAAVRVSMPRSRRFIFGGDSGRSRAFAEPTFAARHIASEVVSLHHSALSVGSVSR